MSVSLGGQGQYFVQHRRDVGVLNPCPYGIDGRMRFQNFAFLGNGRNRRFSLGHRALVRQPYGAEASFTEQRYDRVFRKCRGGVVDGGAGEHTGHGFCRSGSCAVAGLEFEQGEFTGERGSFPFVAVDAQMVGTKGFSESKHDVQRVFGALFIDYRALERYFPLYHIVHTPLLFNGMAEMRKIAERHGVLALYLDRKKGFGKRTADTEYAEDNKLVPQAAMSRQGFYGKTACGDGGKQIQENRRAENADSFMNVRPKKQEEHFFILCITVGHREIEDQ